MSAAKVIGAGKKSAPYVNMVFIAIAGFIGGMILEVIMRYLYIERVKSAGKTVTETSPALTVVDWLSLQENLAGVIVSLMLLVLGYATKVRAIKFMGYGGFGYIGAKMTNNCFLPTIVES